jgi:hypothetical protein
VHYLLGIAEVGMVGSREGPSRWARGGGMEGTFGDGFGNVACRNWELSIGRTAGETRGVVANDGRAKAVDQSIERI